ncbi:MAG: hypothetical protein K0S01_4171, partial [Herbinix sp.]|nr:hypothetical protein [Herbinix sp.]
MSVARKKKAIVIENIKLAEDIFSMWLKAPD